MSSGITSSLRPSALNGTITADFTFTAGASVSGQTVYDFVATASTTAGRVGLYYWIFPDAGVSPPRQSGQTTSASFVKGATYAVQLLVRDSAGGEKIITKNIPVA